MASMCAASQLGEANAAAPCSDTSSEKGRIAGYRTNKHPAMIRAAALRRTRDAMTDGAIVVLIVVKPLSFPIALAYCGLSLPTDKMMPPTAARSELPIILLPRLYEKSLSTLKGGSTSLQESTRRCFSRCFWPSAPALETLSSLFHTVSPRTPVNKGNEEGRSPLGPQPRFRGLAIPASDALATRPTRPGHSP